MKKLSLIAGAAALLAAAVLVGCNLFAATLTVNISGTSVPYNGTYHWGTSSGTKTVTLTNSGSNTLNLTSGPNYVTLNPQGTFSYTQPSTGTLAVNASTSFSVTANGTGTTVVSIPNSSGQNPFTFTITVP